MVAILESLEAGEIHDPEHDIEEMLAESASPGLNLFQLHLRQALVSIAVADVADAQHHVLHSQALADPANKKSVNEVLELLAQGESHQVEHEIQELLGLQHD